MPGMIDAYIELQTSDGQTGRISVQSLVEQNPDFDFNRVMNNIAANPGAFDADWLYKKLIEEFLKIAEYVAAGQEQNL